MSAFTQIASKIGLAALLGLAATASSATTTEYIHTDALGSVVAVSDSSRVVIERREYEPFGQQLTPVVQNGPGYTGHVQDAATGLTYMQQRYYDPVVGRFLSVDPVTADGNNGANFNRYWYANNNPYRFIDPDGRECRSAGGETTCTVGKQGEDLPQVFTFETPDGFPEHTSDNSFWSHEYRYEDDTGGKSDQAVQQAIVNDPTPGNDRPATSRGTSNDAGPTSGPRRLLTIFSDSPVQSHKFVDKKGNTWTVNVTEKDHPLFPGFVLRGAVDGKIITYGQGVGKLQAGGAVSQLLIDDVWKGQNQANIKGAQ